MTFPCSKKPVTLVFCILECLFISGLLNGWTWLQDVLQDEGYYKKSCNDTKLVSLNLHETAGMMSFYREGSKETKDLPTHQKGKNCRYIRVKKIVTLAEYDEMKEMEKKSPIINNQTDPANVTAPECSSETGDLELFMTVVVIIRNVLLFPLGIFLDMYGTTRARIVAM